MVPKIWFAAVLVVMCLGW